MLISDILMVCADPNISINHFMFLINVILKLFIRTDKNEEEKYAKMNCCS